MAGILLFPLWCCRPAAAQGSSAAFDADKGTTISGTVLNRVTNEPVGRALVSTPDQRFAAMTDDRGHFQFIVPLQEIFRSAIPYLQVRKQGFLEPQVNSNLTTTNGATIYLDPEGLIVGKLTAADAESMLRFRLELYRRQVREGGEHWQQVGGFTSLADGEFRFWNLSAGTYKLVSREQIDQDLRAPGPNAPQFGYPATFYSGSSDFDTAARIRIRAGQTVEANFALQRQRYFPVKIPFVSPGNVSPGSVSPGNGPASGIQKVLVYPLGHPGPGFSLGYDPAQQAIRGTLPEGTYTVTIVTAGQPTYFGTTNFTVQGAPLEGSPMNLLATSPITVKVSELFKSGADGRSGNNSTIGFSTRHASVGLLLTPSEDFGIAEPRAGQVIEVEGQSEMQLPDVLPGRYHLQVTPPFGYVAAATCGGVDLLRQPLVVGPGGVGAPIEVTLRDDGAEVSGTVEEETSASSASVDANSSPGQPAQSRRPQRYVYFVPTVGSTGQYREISSDNDGTFSENQLPPGEYLVLAFSEMQPDMSLASAETIARYSSAGEMIEAAAGQSLQLRVKLIPEGTP